MIGKIVNFDKHGDNRGQLVAIEGENTIPFKIERVYYIFDTKKDVIRGKHAHRDLEQVLICVNGSCKIILDDGSKKEEYILDKKDEGLYIGNNIWREMYDFEENTVLLVLASKKYCEDDYIRDYKKFLESINIGE